MNALRMVWIISRHYSEDQRMGSLFQRIALEIGDRVEGAIDLRQLFKQSPQEAVELVRVCKSVLEHWYITYMQVRVGSLRGEPGWVFPRRVWVRGSEENVGGFRGCGCKVSDEGVGGVSRGRSGV